MDEGRGKNKTVQLPYTLPCTTLHHGLQNGPRTATESCDIVRMCRMQQPSWTFFGKEQMAANVLDVVSFFSVEIFSMADTRQPPIYRLFRGEEQTSHAITQKPENAGADLTVLGDGSSRRRCRHNGSSPGCSRCSSERRARSLNQISSCGRGGGGTLGHPTAGPGPELHPSQSQGGRFSYCSCEFGVQRQR